jgi:hypothetical protein
MTTARTPATDARIRAMGLSYHRAEGSYEEQHGDHREVGTYRDLLYGVAARILDDEEWDRFRAIRPGAGR